MCLDGRALGCWWGIREKRKGNRNSRSIDVRVNDVDTEVGDVVEEAKVPAEVVVGAVDGGLLGGVVSRCGGCGVEGRGTVAGLVGVKEGDWLVVCIG